MSLDFFNEACQYPSISNQRFGLCDDQNDSQAYPDFENESTWIAEVINKESFEIVVTAIDKCVLKDNEYEGRDRCDCMLTTKTHLYLVELKNKRKKWIGDAVDQLESTIWLLKENHDISRFKKRKIFASNRKRRFVEIPNAENTVFLRRTGFLKAIQTRIEIM